MLGITPYYKLNPIQVHHIQGSIYIYTSTAVFEFLIHIYLIFGTFKLNNKHTTINSFIIWIVLSSSKLSFIYYQSLFYLPWEISQQLYLYIWVLVITPQMVCIIL